MDGWIILLLILVSIVGSIIEKANKSKARGANRPETFPRRQPSPPPWMVITGQTVPAATPDPGTMAGGEGVSLEAASPWAGEGEPPIEDANGMIVKERVLSSWPGGNEPSAMEAERPPGADFWGAEVEAPFEVGGDDWPAAMERDDLQPAAQTSPALIESDLARAVLALETLGPPGGWRRSASMLWRTRFKHR